MPHRMQLRLDDKTYAVLKELSELTGASASSIVATMLQQARNTLARSAQNIRSAGRTQGEIFESVARQYGMYQRYSGQKVPLRRKPRTKDSEHQED